MEKSIDNILEGLDREQYADALLNLHKTGRRADDSTVAYRLGAAKESLKQAINHGLRQKPDDLSRAVEALDNARHHVERAQAELEE